ncbi:PEP-CTERM sorting domain-containing protein [Marinobacter mangrovi]|uniref:PEP-CTERM sorting domain-containing protein n=1 Tax=Marinobacter mangrovi TaxID=2803918 RepID=UPI0019336B06|nr:PEP-CTERM sorting domain-containing protein [Marinobacter mangrovi]
MDKLIVFVLTALPAAFAFAGYDHCRYNCTPDPVSVPEPGMLGLMATAGAALFLVSRFSKKRQK